MAQSPWKKLAAELQDQGIESKYIARIQARVTPEQRLENVEAEILQRSPARSDAARIA